MTIEKITDEKLIGLLFDRIDDLEQWAAQWWHACGVDGVPPLVSP